MAALGGVPVGPHQHWGSHLICWACRVSAPPCPVPRLGPRGSLLVASGLKERLGFLGDKGHQAPAQASTACSQHSSGLKPWSCAWRVGVGSPPPQGEWQGHYLSPRSHSCARSVGLCWVLMGSQSCFEGGGVRVGPWLGWWHTVITPWRWPSLGTLVTGCAQAGGNLSSWGGWAWARAQHRWHLSPGEFTVTPHPPQPSSPRLGTAGRRNGGSVVGGSPQGQPQSVSATDPGASSPPCRNGNKQPF